MKTEIVKIDRDFTEASDRALLTAAEIINNGGLVVFPTETVYGLGANALSDEAADKIYKAKGRPSDNPLIIHIADPSDAEKYTYTTSLYNRIAELFMPGPLTVVMRAKDIVPMKTRASLPTVAVRCPENPIARRLIELAGVPIAAPSANLSGSPSPTSACHVIDDMDGRVDMIIDGGDSDFGLESTIVKIEDDGTLVLLRPGKITPEELSLVAPVTIAPSVTAALAEGERPLSPGMKYRHYAPKAPVMLLDGERESAVAYVSRAEYKKIALIAYSEDEDFYKDRLSGVEVFSFGEKSDESAQAHKLFYLLRELDKRDYDVIFAPLPEKKGIGLALYNRMIRAAAHRIIKTGEDSNG